MCNAEFIIREVVPRAWSRETSASPDLWTEDRPSIGQCAVTALIVQDFLGGDLLRAQVGEVGHYFNTLADGRMLDLTIDQFDTPPTFKGSDLQVKDRSYVLSYPDTVQRYSLLLGRFSAEADHLTEHFHDLMKSS